jgi:predicted alpha/beta superfamily hydrolase
MIKRTLDRVWSPQLRNRRAVDVYLPSSYPSGLSYPVVYMHDGQNLSDPATAFAGTWELEATIERLAARGREAIVVGIANTEQRLSEYSPFPDRRHGGGNADAYLEFVATTLKTRIDRMFRTEPARDHTAIVGSSMGGLVSLYAAFRFPSIFGRAGVMSPSIWFGQGAVLDFIAQARTPRGRLYLDVGMQEGAGTLKDARRLGRLLVRRGFRRTPRAASALRYVEDPQGRHQEAAWARRLEGALDFLLA